MRNHDSEYNSDHSRIASSTSNAFNHEDTLESNDNQIVSDDMLDNVSCKIKSVETENENTPRTALSFVAKLYNHKSIPRNYIFEHLKDVEN